MSSNANDQLSQVENAAENKPFSQFVLKLSSRCDLACDYCYVYTMADQRWRKQSAVMSAEVIRHTAQRIAEHVGRHRLARVNVVLHGGEPLLAGNARLAATVDGIRAALPPGVRATFDLQTNGVLLDERALDMLAGRGVGISVSLDGDAAAHDRHRRRRDGRGSHRSVARALELLTGPSYRQLFNGLLCTIDLRNDPIRTYQALLSHAPPAVDFLLPHGNWSNAPPGRSSDTRDTPYADWLVAIFDRWYHSAGDVGIRIFTEIIHCLLGGHSAVDGIGHDPVAYVVVDADGGIDVGDTINASLEGAAHSGLNVSTHAFDQVHAVPGVRARTAELASLCDTCDSCPVRDVCGGGLPAHRYLAGQGFAHPSVYCPDLFALITHIGRCVSEDLRLYSTARQ